MSKSINDIKNELANADKETRESLIEVYKGDTRKGVAKLIEKYEKQGEKNNGNDHTGSKTAGQRQLPDHRYP